MRFATWNINGLRARLEFVLAWLDEREPDVVGLQELKLSDEQFPGDAFEALGYQVLKHGQKAWNGVAILSRKPARLSQTGLPGQEDFGARLISAEIGDPGAEISFTSVYCPNGKDLDHDDYPRKLAWFDSLREHLGEAHEAGHDTLLVGDFNICIGELDSWNPEKSAGRIFHTDAERARMQALGEWGLTDLYRELHPDERAFTWWDYRGGAFHRKQGLRIDLLLATPSLARRVKAVTIDREWRKKKDGLTASDHAPVYADID